MGDRVSIQFKDKYDSLSPVLFAHWGGMDFVAKAHEFVKKIRANPRPMIQGPLERMESGTMLVEFIRWCPEESLYLEVSENHGDNSDNGHHIVDCISGEDF